jgi:hypothetical protein
MAMYVCGNSGSAWVISIDPTFAESSGDLTIYIEDHKKHEVTKRSYPVQVLAHTRDEARLICEGVEGRIVRKGKADISKGGREKDYVRVSGLRSFANGEQGFVRFYDDELQEVLELHEYSVCTFERAGKGLPLGPHLEARFQNIYYGIDSTRFVLSRIIGELSDEAQPLWDKYRSEPFGAAWETNDELEPKFLPVTIVARDDVAVIFYNVNGRGEDFRLGTLTAEKCENDDYIVRDRGSDQSELATLQLALDRLWDPQSYRDAT